MAIGTIDNNGRRQISVGIIGVLDNDILIETGDVSEYGTHVLTSEVNTVDVDVELVAGGGFTTQIALEDLESLTPATRVIVTTGAGMFMFKGNYQNIRVRQNGAGVASASLMSTK